MEHFFTITTAYGLCGIIVCMVIICIAFQVYVSMTGHFRGFMQEKLGRHIIFSINLQVNESSSQNADWNSFSDATTTGEEQANLQTKLKSLSSELVTLRSRLHPAEHQNAEVRHNSQNPPTMVRPPVQKFQQSGCAPSLQNGHIQQPVFNGKLIKVFTIWCVTGTI